MWWKINRLIFIILLVVIAVTFFIRKSYRSVDDIDPSLYKQPLQLESVTKTPIYAKIKGFEYSLTPLYYYEISGLIVSKKDYSFFSIYKRNKSMPLDLCMIWGGNVASKVYQSKGLKFEQGFRFCTYMWKHGLAFNQNEVSNNHLIAANDIVNDKLKGLMPGDQVKIIGRLVNVSARNVSGPEEYDPAYFSFNTSTIRTDTGAGACEVIYVEDFEVLKKAHPISNCFYKMAISGLLLLVVLNVLRLFVPARFYKRYQ